MRVILFILLLLGATGAQAAWHRAESANFIVYGEMDQADARETAIKLERLDQAMRRLAGVTQPPSEIKFRVYVVRSAGDVRERLEDADADIAGFYTPMLRGPAAVIPGRRLGNRRFGLGSDEILFHEYAHHFMLHYFPATYPAWYVEGFAEFFQTATFEEDGRLLIGRMSGNRALGLAFDSWVPYARLLANERDYGFNAYTQGWLLTHYAAFDETAGRMLREYLAAIHRGQSGAQAFAATFGRADRPIDRTLQAYMRQRRLPAWWLTLDQINAADVSVTALSEEEGEIAMLFARDPRAMTDEAARLAGRYPDNPQAQIEVAVSALAIDDFTAAEAAADRALAIDARHVEANLVKGLALIGAARDFGEDDDPRWAEGRRLLVRANNADPNNAAPLLGYYQSFPNPAERPEDAMTALEGAFGFVPQNPDLRLALAIEYLRDGRGREAAILVMPIAQSPHDGDARAAARALLNQAGALAPEASGENADASPRD